MDPVKRLEIVVEAALEPDIERLIEQAGIDGYTLIREVAGHGQRGDRDADGLTGVFQNVCFVIAAQPAAATRFLETLRPLLRDSGGMCLVSDAQWLKH